MHLDLMTDSIYANQFSFFFYYLEHCERVAAVQGTSPQASLSHQFAPLQSELHPSAEQSKARRQTIAETWEIRFTNLILENLQQYIPRLLVFFDSFELKGSLQTSLHHKKKIINRTPISSAD